jgi:hypothetical protein
LIEKNGENTIDPSLQKALRNEFNLPRIEELREEKKRPATNNEQMVEESKQPQTQLLQ